MDDEARVPGGRSRWSGLAALGLALAAAGPILFLIAALLWRLDVGGDAAFMVGTAVLGLVGALLAWRFGTWAKILAIVAAVILAVMPFWTAFGLAAPNSFFDFMPGLLVIPGALLAIGASIASIVAKRRGHVGPTPGERRGTRIALGIVAAAALVSAVLTFTGRSSARGGNVTVAMKDSKFQPAFFNVQNNWSVLLRNEDPFVHTFTIKELGINETLTPGSSRTVRLQGESRTYTYYCVPHTRNPEKPERTTWPVG